jgi:hypothetical protein
MLTPVVSISPLAGTPTTSVAVVPAISPFTTLTGALTIIAPTLVTWLNLTSQVILNVVFTSNGHASVDECCLRLVDLQPLYIVVRCSKAARDYLAIPASEVLVERLISSGRDM